MTSCNETCNNKKKFIFNFQIPNVRYGIKYLCIIYVCNIYTLHNISEIVTKI